MKRIVYAIFGLAVLAVAGGFALPRHLHVEVTQDIDAHPATVFALVNDFHRVDLWAPLNDNDPNARIVYSGPDRGAGAAVRWDGTIVGSGTQIIVESLPYERVETVVDSDGHGESRSRYRLEKTGAGTRLTWDFETDYGYDVIGRYLALLLEDVVRRDHEEASTRLKQLAESLPGADFSDIQIENLSVEAQTIAYLPTTSIPEPAAMSDAMGAAYFEILSFIDAHGLREAGAPMSITRSFSGGELLFDAAIPVRGLSDETPRGDSGVRIGETYSGPVIRVRHVGPYRTLGDTHRKIAAYLAALGIARAGPAWEAYVSDPTKVREDELVTYVYYPVVSNAREPAVHGLNST